MDVVEASAGEVTVAMDVREGHVTLQGLVHGGMLAILADTACGLSIRSAIEPGRLHVTSDLDIHFLAPARPGPLFGEANVVQLGRTVGFIEGRLMDKAGTLLARDVILLSTLFSVPAVVVVALALG